MIDEIFVFLVFCVIALAAICLHMRQQIGGMKSVIEMMEERSARDLAAYERLREELTSTRTELSDLRHHARILALEVDKASGAYAKFLERKKTAK